MHLKKLLKKLSTTLPQRPDGTIDYSNAKKAAVVTIFVKHNNKILLLRRSNKVATYKDKWSTVTGYLDEFKPLKEKVLAELKEEVGIVKKDIGSSIKGKPYQFFDSNVGTTWIIFPVLAELKQKPQIKLDWEHTEYRWIVPAALSKFDTVPNIDQTLQKLL